MGIAHSSWTAFSKDIAFFHTAFFPQQKEGGDDYVVEKITKINKGIGHKFW